MKLQRIEDFEVWKKAQAFWEAVSAILTRPAFSKGFVAETYTRLCRAHRRGWITDSERHGFEKQAAEVGRIITGLIKHLLKTPNRKRGIGQRLTTAVRTNHE
jgi:hypothetical protein